MQNAVRSQTATGNSAPVPLNHFITPFNATIAVVIAGGTATAKVQFTVDDPQSFPDLATFQANAAWFDHATLTALSASATGNIAYPVRAVRTVVSAISGATVTTTVLQAGVT